MRRDKMRIRVFNQPSLPVNSRNVVGYETEVDWVPTLVLFCFRTASVTRHWSFANHHIRHCRLTHNISNSIFLGWLCMLVVFPLFFTFTSPSLQKLEWIHSSDSRVAGTLVTYSCCQFKTWSSKVSQKTLIFASSGLIATSRRRTKTLYHSQPWASIPAHSGFLCWTGITFKWCEPVRLEGN